MLIAFLISDENLDMIADMNDGVRPLIEEKTTYFIAGGEHNVIVNSNFFHQYFDVKQILNAQLSRYIVTEK